MNRKSFYFLIYLLCLFLLTSFTACSETSNTKIEAFSAAKLYITTLDKSKLLTESSVLENSSELADVIITVDTSQTYQVIDGFGYTLNGGSALHLQSMSTSARSTILRELFERDSNSIGVSYLRLSIGASDLDERPWSYNDLSENQTDPELDQFSLAYDTLYLIPTLKEILQIAPDVKLMGSPWSPPVWMKDNNATHGGSLKPEYYLIYANYLTKYVQGMKNEGIEIDALTIQNEPLNPDNNPSLLMLADQQADFIKNHLGPSFLENNITTKIIIYDHNADRPDYPISILNDPDAGMYVDGSAFHLYGGTIDALSEVNKAHPNKNIYFTEQWIGAPGNFAGDFSWHIENLIIGATRNWSKTVLEWNLAADENQEPHTEGGCDACLGALTISGDEVTRNTAYYVIGHVAKFVVPGSERIATDSVTGFPNVAFRTPEGEKVVVIQNKDDSVKTVQIRMGVKTYLISLEGGAVGTLVI